MRGERTGTGNRFCLAGRRAQGKEDRGSAKTSGFGEISPSRRLGGQTLSEYVILITLIVTAIAALFPMVKRGTQSIIRSAADQIADQRDADQEFDRAKGFMLGSDTTTQETRDDEVVTKPAYIAYKDTVYSASKTNSVSNLGFTEQEE